MKRYRDCINSLLIVFVAVLLSIPVLAIENDSPIKIAHHQENPILNNNNTIIGSTPISSSGSENTVEQQTEEGCYCDVENVGKWKNVWKKSKNWNSSRSTALSWFTAKIFSSTAIFTVAASEISNLYPSFHYLIEQFRSRFLEIRGWWRSKVPGPSSWPTTWSASRW